MSKIIEKRRKISHLSDREIKLYNKLALSENFEKETLNEDPQLIEELTKNLEKMSK